MLKYNIMNAQLQRMCNTAKIVHIAICEGFLLSFYIWGVVSNNHVDAVIGTLPFLWHIHKTIGKAVPVCHSPRCECDAKHHSFH